MAFSKGPGKGYRLVVEFSPINDQCELMPRPSRNPELRVRNVLASWLFVL